jgi:hypothetical protein
VTKRSVPLNAQGHPGKRANADIYAPEDKWMVELKVKKCELCDVDSSMVGETQRSRVEHHGGEHYYVNHRYHINDDYHHISVDEPRISVSTTCVSTTLKNMPTRSMCISYFWAQL